MQARITAFFFLFVFIHIILYYLHTLKSYHYFHMYLIKCAVSRDYFGHMYRLLPRINSQIPDFPDSQITSTIPEDHHQFLSEAVFAGGLSLTISFSNNIT